MEFSPVEVVLFSCGSEATTEPKISPKASKSDSLSAVVPIPGLKASNNSMMNN